MTGFFIFPVDCASCWRVAVAAIHPTVLTTSEGNIHSGVETSYTRSRTVITAELVWLWWWEWSL